MRATIILSAAALAGLASSSPAPQQLDFAQISAAPAVQSGPSGSALNQTVVVQDVVEVTSVANAAAVQTGIVKRNAGTRALHVLRDVLSNADCLLWRQCNGKDTKDIDDLALSERSEPTPVVVYKTIVVDSSTTICPETVSSTPASKRPSSVGYHFKPSASTTSSHEATPAASTWKTSSPGPVSKTSSSQNPGYGHPSSSVVTSNLLKTSSSSSGAWSQASSQSTTSKSSSTSHLLSSSSQSSAFHPSSSVPSPGPSSKTYSSSSTTSAQKSSYVPSTYAPPTSYGTVSSSTASSHTISLPSLSSSRYSSSTSSPVQRSSSKPSPSSTNTYSAKTFSPSSSSSSSSSRKTLSSAASSKSTSKTSSLISSTKSLYSTHPYGSSVTSSSSSSSVSSPSGKSTLPSSTSLSSFLSSSAPSTSPVIYTTRNESTSSVPTSSTTTTKLQSTKPSSHIYSSTTGASTTIKTSSGTSTTSSSTECPTQIEEGTYCGFINPEDPCAPQPGGYGPVSSPDTVDAFEANEVFHSEARAAPTTVTSSSGSGVVYNQVFKDLKASVNAASYLGLYTLTSYDTSECALKCDQTNLCTSFNLYIERDPSQAPSANDSTAPTVWGYWCPDPPSITNYKCSLWGSSIDASQAVNYGETREEFKVVITASNGYDKTNASVPSCTIPAGSSSTSTASSTSTGSSSVTPHWSTAKDCDGKAIDSTKYWMGSKFFPGPFNAQVCADYAWQQNAANKAAAQAMGIHLFTPCKFFNSYYLYKNDAPHGTYCNLYSTVLDNSYATYQGGWSGKDHYECMQSWTFSLEADPSYGTC